MRRLTDRQIAVLAAVERLGRPTLPDLWAYLGVGGFGAPAIPPDEIVRFRVRPRGSDTPRERLESRGA